MTAYSITGDDSIALLAPSLESNLFLLRRGTQGYPTSIRISGVIEATPEVVGVVYAYPYKTTDYVVSMSDQACDVPVSMQSSDYLDAFRRAGQAIALAEGHKAPTVSNQVWQLVRDGLLVLRRVRNPVFYAQDGRAVDFVPLTSCPLLLAKYDTATSSMIVSRNMDSGVAQKVYGYALDPTKAKLVVSEAIADADGAAVFPVVHAVGEPYATFLFMVTDDTHKPVIGNTGGAYASATPIPQDEIDLYEFANALHILVHSTLPYTQN